MGLKEILAAKKAAAEAEAAKASSAPVEHQQAITDAAADAESEQEEQKVSMIAAEDPGPAPAPVVDTSKLSFAEKLKLKQQQIKQAQTAPPPAPKKPEIDPAMIPEDEADAQAYVDIKTKIVQLEDLMDEDLKNGMAQLKQALKKNPNAALLMLDSDIGKMVIALRRMTHVEIEIAKEPKKRGKKTDPKAKAVQLTADQIAAAFDEL